MRLALKGATMTEQTNERYCVLVNGHAVEPGCWVEGHWGQYGPDHLADRATEVGWEPGDWADDPRQIRGIITTIETWGYAKSPDVQNVIDAMWELRAEAADSIEEWLNDRTDGDWAWGWHDGEFYLWSTADWEENSW
jgi:hypothetical protein